MLFLTWQGSVILSERGELLELKPANEIEERPTRGWHGPSLALPTCCQMTRCWVCSLWLIFTSWSKACYVPSPQQGPKMLMSNRLYPRTCGLYGKFLSFLGPLGKILLSVLHASVKNMNSSPWQHQ